MSYSGIKHFTNIRHYIKKILSVISRLQGWGSNLCSGCVELPRLPIGVWEFCLVLPFPHAGQRPTVKLSGHLYITCCAWVCVPQDGLTPYGSTPALCPASDSRWSSLQWFTKSNQITRRGPCKDHKAGITLHASPTKNTLTMGNSEMPNSLTVHFWRNMRRTNEMYTQRAEEGFNPPNLWDVHLHYDSPSYHSNCLT